MFRINIVSYIFLFLLHLFLPSWGRLYMSRSSVWVLLLPAACQCPLLGRMVAGAPSKQVLYFTSVFALLLHISLVLWVFAAFLIYLFQLHYDNMFVLLPLNVFWYLRYF